MNIDPAVRVYRVDYQLHHESRQHELQLPVTQLRNPQAALHLLQLHFGDGENSLLMPNADASAEQILAQAAVMGITEVQVVDSGGVPAPASREQAPSPQGSRGA